MMHLVITIVIPKSTQTHKEEETMATNKDQTPNGTGGPTDRKTLNVMLGMGLLNQTDQTQRSFVDSGGMVQRKEEYLPKPLRFLSAIGGLFLTVGCVGLILYFFTAVLSDPHPLCLPAAGLGLGVGIPLYGGLRGLEAYLERKAWLRRNGSQREDAPGEAVRKSPQESSEKGDR